MPTLPTYTKCGSLGCRESRSKYNSYCLIHGGKDALPITKKRADNNALYKSLFWQRLRVAQLSKHPLCACCLTKGRVTQATHVDHVFPWTHINPAAFYRNIFQSLCNECHGEKSYYETQGVIKYYGFNDLTLKDYGQYCNV